MYLVETWNSDKTSSLGISEMTNEEFMTWAAPVAAGAHYATVGEFTYDGKVIAFEQKEDVDDARAGVLEAIFVTGDIEEISDEATGD